MIFLQDAVKRQETPTEKSNNTYYKTRSMFTTKSKQSLLQKVRYVYYKEQRMHAANIRNAYCKKQGVLIAK